MSLSKLREEYVSCTKCSELCETRSQVVFGSGDEQAKVLFIGEAPGATEDREGIPFCGASGRILKDLLAHIGLTRDDVFITNTVICRPPKNRNPKKDEIAHCKPRLDRTIEELQPRVIVTIGNFATKAIIGQAGITQIRGKVFERDFNGQEFKVVPVVHPANLLYNGHSPTILAQMKEDFEKIGEVIGQSAGLHKKGQVRPSKF